MNSQSTCSVFLEKTFQKDPETILKFFHDSAFLELTGADKIESDFQPGGNFCLTFTNRGIIRGKYLSITNNAIVLDWNVEGFLRPAEFNTLLEITLETKNEKCKFTLRHTNIINQEAALAKEKAWISILNDFEHIL